MSETVHPGIAVDVFTRLRSLIGIAIAVPFTLVWSVIVSLGAMTGSRRVSTGLMRTWSAVVLGVFGIRVETKGEENLPSSGGGIVVFNHQSYFDIPVLMLTTPKHIRFGAKIELFSIPLFGMAMRKVGTLPIARDNRTEVLRIYREAERNFADNILFALAPEGTRQSEPKLGRFKKGPFVFALNAGVPVIPAVVKGAHTVLAKDSFSVNVGRMSRTILVEYLPAVPTKNLAEKPAPDQLTDRVKAMMSEVYNRS